MNKKGEFSAADLKKPVGRKERADTGSLFNNSKTPGRFVCHDCQQDTADENLGERKSPYLAWCKACSEKKKSLIDGTYRTPQGQTIEAVRRGSRKFCQKSYKKGRLPKWMFT
jgi:hypothetical protein